MAAQDNCTTEKTPSPFHIAEYQALYSDAEANAKTGFDVVIYATVANGFMVAWMLQFFEANIQAKQLEVIGIAIPVILTAFAILKFRHCTARIKHIFIYIYTMEKVFRENNLGYQHFYRDSHYDNYLKNAPIAYLALGVQLFLLLMFSVLILFDLL